MLVLMTMLLGVAFGQANPDDATVGLDINDTRLKASVKIGPGVRGGRKIIIESEDDFAWSSCKVTLNGFAFNGYHQAMDSFAPGTITKMVAGEFKNTIGDEFDADGEIINVIIKCEEGWTMVWPGSNAMKKKW